jgi:hypothetical protein
MPRAHPGPWKEIQKACFAHARALFRERPVQRHVKANANMRLAAPTGTGPPAAEAPGKEGPAAPSGSSRSGSLEVPAVGLVQDGAAPANSVATSPAAESAAPEPAPADRWSFLPERLDGDVDMAAPELPGAEGVPAASPAAESAAPPAPPSSGAPRSSATPPLSSAAPTSSNEPSLQWPSPADAVLVRNSLSGPPLVVKSTDYRWGDPSLRGGRLRRGQSSPDLFHWLITERGEYPEAWRHLMRAFLDAQSTPSGWVSGTAYAAITARSLCFRKARCGCCPRCLAPRS